MSARTSAVHLSTERKLPPSVRAALAGCYHISSPYAYRNPFNESDRSAGSAVCGRAGGRNQISRARHCCRFHYGASVRRGGVIPPHPSFMPMVREICDRYGILLIADEVITAFGRTGGWTGSRLWGVQPDLMSTAKYYKRILSIWCGYDS